MAWYNVNWQYRIKVTTLAAKVDTDFTNYPVYLDLSLLPAAFWSHVKADGSDIVITEGETTKCSRELVWITAGSSIGELYFKGNILDASNVDFYVYYGNSGGAEVNDTSTWNSDFKLVHHDQIAGDPDSTSNANTGTNSNVTTGVAGKLGLGYTYNGTTSKTTVTTNAGLTNIFSGAGATVAAWINVTSQGEGNFGRILWKCGAGTLATNGFTIFTGDNSAGTCRIYLLRGYSGNVPQWYSSARIVTYGGWQHMIFSWVEGDNVPVCYMDGTNKAFQRTTAAPSGTPNTDTSNDLIIGNDQDTTRSYNGSLDEIWIIGRVLTANERTTIYNNQFSPATFFTVGSEETTQTPGLTLAGRQIQVITNTSGTPKKRITIDNSGNIKINKEFTDSNFIIQKNTTGEFLNYDAGTDTNILNAANHIIEGAGVINETGADKDWRIEGVNDANLIYTDAGNDRVGVGTATPDSKLMIDGSADVTQLKVQGHSTQNANILEIENSATNNLVTVDPSGNLYSCASMQATSGFDCGDAGGFSGLKFNAGTTQLEVWLDGIKIGHFDNTGAYTDDVP